MPKTTRKTKTTTKTPRKRVSKYKLESKLSETSIKGAIAYRQAIGSTTYVDIYGKSNASIRMRNRVTEFFSTYAQSGKGELTTLMYMKSTQFKQLSRVDLTQTEANKIINRFLNRTMVGIHKDSRGTLKSFILANHTTSEFASTGIESDEIEMHAKQFFDEETQQSIAKAFSEVL